MKTISGYLMRGIMLAAISGTARSPSSANAQTFSDHFDTLDRSIWTQVDRGELAVHNGVLTMKDCYVHAGDIAWKNYSMEFKARAPEDASEVRIFAGFRFNSDKNRYVFGLRGGNNNDLFLARYGDRNKSAILAIEPLDFIPQKGVWYTIRIQIEERGIRVFLNNESKARLSASDAGGPFESGKISLGGGWAEVEFDEVNVSPLKGYELHKSAKRYNFQRLEDPSVEGWIPVNHDVYSKEKGIGWNEKGVFPRKRNQSDNPLFDSLVGFSSLGSKVLLADLPDGDYVVSVGTGDPAYRSKNRIFFMDELQPSINNISGKGQSNLLRKSITTYGGKLRMRFELDEPGVGGSFNWLAIETREQAGEEAWEKYHTVIHKNDLEEKEAFRRDKRAAYQKRVIAPPNDERTVYSLNGDWLFIPDYEVGKIQPWGVAVDDGSWHVLDVPNFWTPHYSWNYRAYGLGRGSPNWFERELARCEAHTFDYKKAKTGYYRHTLILPENLSKKTVQINFEAIGREAELWVNGHFVKSRTGMFAPLRADITAQVHPGENIVVVRAGDSLRHPAYNTGDAGRAPIHLMWNGNRGIWQNVTLEISDELTIDDTFFKPGLNHFDLAVTLNNRAASPVQYRLAAQIRDRANNRLVYDHFRSSRTTRETEAGQQTITTLSSEDSEHAAFKNWSPELPNLYTADIFAYNYNRDPAVDLSAFSKDAIKLNAHDHLKKELFSFDLPNGEYLITLRFGNRKHPSLAEAYIGREETRIEQAIVRDFCKPGQFVNVLQSLTIKNGKLEMTIPRLPAPGAKTHLTGVVIEKREDISEAKWKLGLNHFNVLDNVTYNVGFRTISVDGDNIMLNGKPFKLRGATLTPNLLRPNDKPLADWFMKTLHENNISVTKNHACPFNNIWLTAADEAGVGTSVEGIWVWLMLKGKGIPNQAMLEIWMDEYTALLNQQKNHPSLLWLTHNSEMKLWISNEKERYEIHSNAVKQFRKIDPTRPVVCSTGYARGYVEGIGGKLPDIDDGDIDDSHTFHNWYDCENFFWLRDGVSYTKGKRVPGRPYVSNEFATGYPDADTGHPIKHYIYDHFVPQALVGKWCYEDRNPKYWLKRLALINKESHETIRTAYRDTSAGMMLFALGTWFQNLYDVETIKPYATLATVAQALEPVMVSAQLGGRHFYAGASHTVNAVVVNDSPTYETLENIGVVWEVSHAGHVLSSGTKKYSGSLAYYKNKDENLTFTLPKQLPEPRINAELVLKLHANGRAISTNSYDIVVADKQFVSDADSLRVGYYTQDNCLSASLSILGTKAIPVKNLKNINHQSFDVLIIDRLTTKPEGYENIIPFVEAGGRVLLSSNKDFVIELLPEEVTGSTTKTKEIVTPNTYISPVFDGIEPDDICWFTGTRDSDESPRPGHVPIACERAYNVNVLPHVTRLAETTKVHGYHHKENDTYHPRDSYDQIHGYPLVEIQKGNGRIIVSSMMLEAERDPIAGKLLANILEHLNK